VKPVVLVNLTVTVLNEFLIEFSSDILFLIGIESVDSEKTRYLTSKDRQG
jgi:hypothetical protein